MSRVQDRANTKSLACQKCKGTKGQVVISFKGQSQNRLDLHMREVHGERRKIAVKV